MIVKWCSNFARGQQDKVFHGLEMGICVKTFLEWKGGMRDKFGNGQCDDSFKIMMQRISFMREKFARVRDVNKRENDMPSLRNEGIYKIIRWNNEPY